MSKTRPLMIFGAGRGGLDIYQLLRQCSVAGRELNFRVVGVVDPKGTAIFDLPVWRELPDLANLGEGPVYGISGNQDPRIRKRIFDDEIVGNGLKLATVVHPSVDVPDDLILEEGSVIYPGVCIGHEVTIRRGTLVNYLSLIGAGVSIGEFSFIGPKACLTADCSVGSLSIIGASATMIPGIQIGNECVIGMGSKVFTNIPDHHRLVDLPRQYLRPTKELKRGRVSWREQDEE